jgi:hypothetical protein
MHNKKLTALILVIVGAVIVIVTTAIAGALNKGIKDSVKDIWVYSYDTKFDDPNYEDCSDEIRSYYFYNITNIEEYIGGLEKMKLELKVVKSFSGESKSFAGSLQLHNKRM